MPARSFDPTAVQRMLSGHEGLAGAMDRILGGGGSCGVALDPLLTLTMKSDRAQRLVRDAGIDQDRPPEGWRPALDSLDWADTVRANAWQRWKSACMRDRAGR